jgi:hypothetical protein
MVLVVLRRPNENAVGVFWARLAKESGSPSASHEIDKQEREVA